MATVTNDIVTRFAFEGNLSPLGDFNSQMADGVKFMAVFAAALAGTGIAISKWATDISQGEDAVGQLARNTGVSVEAIGELSHAADMTGSSAGALRSSISSLSQKIGEASITGSEDFARIGISVRGASGQIKKADQVLLELAGRVKGLSREQTQDFASRLGIDESLVQLLQTSSGGIAAFRQEAIALGRTTTEQSNKMLAYNDSVKKMNTAFDGLKVQLTVGLIPKLQDLAEGMTTWLVQSSEDLVAAFVEVRDLTLIVMESLNRMIPVFAAVGIAIVALKIQAMGLMGVLGLFSKLPIILVLTGLYLIVDDLMTAFSGGESVIGKVYDALSGGRSIVDDMESAFNALARGINALWGTLTKIGKILVSMAEGIVKFFGKIARGESIVGDLTGAFDAFLGKIKPVWDIISKIATAVASMGSASIDFIASFFGGDDDNMAENKLAPSLSGMYKSHQGMLGSPTTNNKNANITNQTSIEIRTSDPVRAGEEVVNALSRQTEDAYIQSGVSPR